MSCLLVPYLKHKPVSSVNALRDAMIILQDFDMDTIVLLSQARYLFVWFAFCDEKRESLVAECVNSWEAMRGFKNGDSHPNAFIPICIQMYVSFR